MKYYDFYREVVEYLSELLDAPPQSLWRIDDETSMLVFWKNGNWEYAVYENRKLP